MGAGMRALAAALLLLATAAPAAADVAASHHGGGAWSPWYTSPLWGKAGELWTPAGRLADWSMAGYGGDGRTPLPVYRNTGRFDITRFGASPAPGFDNAPAVQAAIAAAGAAAQRERCGQVVYIPPGQWWINQTVFVNVSHVALRGAGPRRSVLFFPNGLEAIYGSGTAWEFSGAFVGIQGTNPRSRWMEPEKLALLTPVLARRGTRVLQVNSTAALQFGRWYLIAIPQNAPDYDRVGRRRLLDAAPPGLAARLAGLFSHPGLRHAALEAAEGELGLLPAGTTAALAPVQAASSAGAWAPLNSFLEAAAKYAVAHAVAEWAQKGSLGGPAAAAARPGSIDAYLYGDSLVDSGSDPAAMFKTSDRVRFPFRIVRKGATWIEIDRPLPIDLRPEWAPRIYPFSPTVQHSGIESLSLQHRATPYPIKATRTGQNALAVYDAANCWARNIEILNADSAIFVDGAEFATVDTTHIAVTQQRGIPGGEMDGLDGRNGISISHGSYCLVTNARIDLRFLRDVTLTVFQHNSVISRVSGVDINLNHNRAAPHNNLLTALDLGLGTRAWDSNGSKTRGANAGANNTYWDIKATGSAQWMQTPACDFGPLLSFIGRYNASVVPGLCSQTKWTVENTGAQQLLPLDLHQAQRERVRRWGPGAWRHLH